MQVRSLGVSSQSSHYFRLRRLAIVILGGLGSSLLSHSRSGSILIKLALRQATLLPGSGPFRLFQTCMQASSDGLPARGSSNLVISQLQTSVMISIRQDWVPLLSTILLERCKLRSVPICYRYTDNDHQLYD